MFSGFCRIIQLFGNLAIFILKTHGFASQPHSWFAFVTLVNIALDIPKPLKFWKFILPLV